MEEDEQILKFISEEKIEIKGVSVGTQFRLLRRIENLISECKKLQEESFEDYKSYFDLVQEDINLLERKIELNKQMYLEFGRLLSLDEKTEQAIENLINKYKEQENVIELMAEAFKQDDVRSKEEIIEFFRKKAKGE